MGKASPLIPAPDTDIQSRILTVRGVQVMLDSDLALLYGVDLKVFNQAVKRNTARFPQRFMHQLTEDEFEDLKSQIVTSSPESSLSYLKSRFVTSSWGGVRKRPYVFSEQGVSMLSAVLRSPTAIDVSIRIIDAFVAMRRALASLAPLLTRIEAAERRQIVDQSKNDTNQAHNEERFKLIFDAMNDKKFPPQKVFFDGEFFDAFVQMKKFIRQARKELVVIDPYFDDSCLPLIAQRRPGVAVTVVRSAKNAANTLHAVDVAQFNKQYMDALTVKLTDKFHDRYLIIDNVTLIHVGASLNCLGKRCFALSTLDAAFIPDIMARVP